MCFSGTISASKVIMVECRTAFKAVLFTVSKLFFSPALSCIKLFLGADMFPISRINHVTCKNCRQTSWQQTHRPYRYSCLILRHNQPVNCLPKKSFFSHPGMSNCWINCIFCELHKIRRSDSSVCHAAVCFPVTFFCASTTSKMAQNKPQIAFFFTIQAIFSLFNTLYNREPERNQHQQFFKNFSVVEKGPKINAKINRDVAKPNFNVFL